jgi:hypothetical protein
LFGFSYLIIKDLRFEKPYLPLKTQISKSLFSNAKLIDGLLLITLTGIQYNAGEVRTVRRVGEVLCLQAYS